MEQVHPVPWAGECDADLVRFAPRRLTLFLRGPLLSFLPSEPDVRPSSPCACFGSSIPSVPDFTRRLVASGLSLLSLTLLSRKT